MSLSPSVLWLFVTALANKGGGSFHEEWASYTVVRNLIHLSWQLWESCFCVYLYFVTVRSTAGFMFMSVESERK